MHKTGLAMLAGVAGVAIIWLKLGDVRKRSDRAQLKHQVHAWEDEGGNVPDVKTVSPTQSALQ